MKTATVPCHQGEEDSNLLKDVGGEVMKTFQMPKDNKRLYVENLLRIPEDVLLEQVIKRLKTHPEIRIGKRIMGPSEDLYSCRLREEPFSLWFDLETE